MKNRGFVARAFVLAVLTSALVAVGATAGAGSALACGGDGSRSDAVAAAQPQVRPGRFGVSVLALQLALHRLDYPLVGTGFYGPNTLTAVKDFQRRHGIKDSGIVGSRTWHALVGPLPHSSSGLGLIDTSVRPQLYPGVHDPAALERLANALMRIPPYREYPGAASGVYDATWQELVRSFQRRAGIRASGIVGPKTWDALYRSLAVSGGWSC